jgi:16S rRNA (uracil1498-N3)-methyltransferase
MIRDMSVEQSETRTKHRAPALGTSHPAPSTSHPAPSEATEISRAERAHPAPRTVHSTQHRAPSTPHRPYNSAVSSAPRFFVPGLDPGDEVVMLPRDEAEHLTRVLRLGVGDTIAVFDGLGHEFLAKVAGVAGREVKVHLLSRVEPVAESVVPITLVQAVLKGDKMDDVVRDAVMLGVSAIQPIVTRRTEITVAAVLRGARVERWERVALASVKQSRRAVVPEIRTPLAFDTFLREPRPSLELMLMEPGPGGAVEPLSALRDQPAPFDASIWVGPEGGWDDRERTAAREHGARLVSLGRRTLRADAVAVAAISVLEFLWDR